MINDILEKINLHKKRAKAALEEIKEWESLDSEIFENFEKIKTIDTFIYRFIKLQDMMGEKLFKVFLDEIGEYKDNMSLLDILDKLEKFEILKDSMRWMEYRKLRNKLTHEYPNNEDDVIEAQTQFTQLLNQTVFIVDKVICWIMNIFT
ncbi:hypothetical protein [Sulfurimonas sp.]|jgi:hypothetical protein|uniref:hypothetical protein n=1 Tax=Sulfurimonas sp. TaxID=2022749 RepID=UPI0025E54D69|nr:hypothetical protein [Sulfurimonas sp.]MBT5935908.1 hypothetical protein [Sulfurimonas sp.]